MGSSLQLTIGGREEPIELVADRCAPLTAAQVAILRLLAERRTITSSEAGRIVHAHRQPPCERCKRGCCGFTSTDGSDALKRLQARGLARRIAAGRWTAPADGPTAEPPPALPAASSNDRGVRGPKGTRVGDIVVAERSRWRVERIDPERREALCRLIGGSGVYRHFRARQIARVESGAAP